MTMRLCDRNTKSSAFAMDMAQSRHHATVLMTTIQQRLEQVLPISRLMALPDFFVLMIESRTWASFHPDSGGIRRYGQL